MPPAVETNPAINQTVLQADSLSRVISPSASVSDISLRLQRGDVLGLLGLNGAGKTTTLNLLSGVLVPDEGSVTINGYAMREHPLQARAHLGFLPDQPPLYDDLRVHEFLSLAGKIRHLRGTRLHSRMQFVLDQCLLEPVSHKLIGALSKGYRQRVGLAQAIIHEPALLLLDEPSNGLDPQQLDSMRALIAKMAENSAIVLSTHLLSEAQSMCNRVAIIHEGKLIADQSADGENLESIFLESVR